MKHPTKIGVLGSCCWAKKRMSPGRNYRPTGLKTCGKRTSNTKRFEIVENAFNKLVENMHNSKTKKEVGGRRAAAPRVRAAGVASRAEGPRGGPPFSKLQILLRLLSSLTLN